MTKEMATQEDYEALEMEHGGTDYHKYCIVITQEDGGMGIVGEFGSPKDAAIYYKEMIQRDEEPNDAVMIHPITMVSRLYIPERKDELLVRNEDGNYYVADKDIHIGKGEIDAH